MPADPALPGSGALSGEGGRLLVDEFLAHDGWRLYGHRAVQALYHPARSLLVRHSAWARRGDEERRFSLCTELRADAAKPAGAQVWAFPDDPGLPALRQAMDASQAMSWIAPGDDARSVAIGPVAYRPKRRAVLRYRVRAPRRDGGESTSLYVKVLNPEDAERTWRLGELLRGADLPLALPVQRPERDVLVFDQLEGRSLREHLLAGDAAPSPQRVFSLMDEVARLDGVLSNPAGRSGPGGLRHAVRVLRHILPGERDELHALRDEILARIERHPVEPRVIHGDLYEGQVMLREDYSLGLLDLDDIGIGDPAQDAANFTAHLVALADSSPAAGARLLAYRALMRAEVLRKFDVAEEGFAAREALVMVQLATGPFRVLEARWPERVTQRLRLARLLLEERTEHGR